MKLNERFFNILERLLIMDALSLFLSFIDIPKHLLTFMNGERFSWHWWTRFVIKLHITLFILIVYNEYIDIISGFNFLNHDSNHHNNSNLNNDSHRHHHK